MRHLLVHLLRFGCVVSLLFFSFLSKKESHVQCKTSQDTSNQNIEYITNVLSLKIWWRVFGLDWIGWNGITRVKYKNRKKKCCCIAGSRAHISRLQFHRILHEILCCCSRMHNSSYSRLLYERFIILYENNQPLNLNLNRVD